MGARACPALAGLRDDPAGFAPPPGPIAALARTGDLHLPHQVGRALAGEPRADDARMLELLEPFRGNRFRVLRLLLAAGRIRLGRS